MENRMKRRSSIFLQPPPESDDESMALSTAEEYPEQNSKHEFNATQIKSHIKKLTEQRKEWEAEANNLKVLHQKAKAIKTLKKTKSELFLMLSEEDKEKYKSLFSRNDYSALLNSVRDLKKKVIVESIHYERIHDGFDNLIRQNSNRAQYENLMNRLRENDEDLPYESGDSMSDCLDSEEELDDM